MQFLLNGKPCISPSVLLQTCEDNGIDPSPWLGKANCYVDRHGVDPSYGYFLVDSATRATIIAITDDPNAGNTGNYTVLGGSNKAALTIVFTDGGAPRTIYDLYLDSIVNVTPALHDTDAIYLVKLVDARFVFNTSEASKFGNRHHSDNQWFNKVETFLLPAELESEFELDATPDLARFIYARDSVEGYHIDTDEMVEIGTREGTPVEIHAPIGWEELFAAIFTLFCDTTRANVDPVFPYWELNDSTLTLNFESEIFPAWIPQDISLRDRSVRDVLYELLFWSGTSFRYDGEGEFTFFKVKNAPVGVGPNQTDQLTQYLSDLYNPFEIKHLTIETGSESVPEGFSVHYPILDEEKEDNQKQDYATQYLTLDPLEAPPSIPRGRKVPKIQIPIVWVEEREDIGHSPGSSSNRLPDAEYASGEGSISDRAYDIFYDYFTRYPSVVKDYGGFITATPMPFLDRVSWYSLGGTPGTKIESKIPFEWEVMEPLPIFPRELKLSVVIAKVESAVEADAELFTFIEPKLLIGDLFDTNQAYNTIRRSYIAGEEVVLVGGNLDEWRHSSLLLGEAYDHSQIYFTIDDVPYLRIKVPEQYLEELSSGAYKWRVLLENVEVVNGKLPRPDDNEVEQDYIYIKNDPKILLDEEDAFIYIGYDITAGSDVYHRWTTADAQNDILFLKGLPGYVSNPEEPAEGERRLVLKSPYSSTEPIGWLEEAADGRTDEELEDFIIQIIEEQGGTGGGGGGNTTILKGLVNNSTGYASTDATLNWDTGTVLVSDGSVQPTSGTADNTFLTPFLDNEPILLIKKNNGIWTAVKIQENIIVATPNADVASNATDFIVTLSTTIQGTSPAGAITAKGNGFEYMASEKLAFKHGNDNKWHVIERYETTGIFRTTGTISAASFNISTSTLTIGSGNATRLVCNTANPNQYTATGGAVVIKNMTTGTVSANKLIQAKKIGRHWFVDVEACT